MRYKYHSEDIYLIIAKNIKKYRLIRGMTQQDLAYKSGYSYAYIRRIESPQSPKNFSIQTISNLAESLSVDIKHLFSEEDI